MTLKGRRQPYFFSFPMKPVVKSNAKILGLEAIFQSWKAAALSTLHSFVWYSCYIIWRNIIKLILIRWSAIGFHLLWAMLENGFICESSIESILKTTVLCRLVFLNTVFRGGVHPRLTSHMVLSNLHGNIGRWSSIPPMKAKVFLFIYKWNFWRTALVNGMKTCRILFHSKKR